MSLKTTRTIPNEIQLDEGKSAPQKVQLIRVGEFKHPAYGKFKITKDMLLSFVDNFKKNVRGIDLALDYSHQSEQRAAGWFRDVVLSEDGNSLYFVPDWTPSGKKVVEEKEFRYVSADFANDYQCNETGKCYGPTLLGAGLTNRPFVKGMAPAVELTEYTKGNEDDMNLQEALDENKKLSEQNKTLETTLDSSKKEIETLKADNAKLLSEKANIEAEAIKEKALAEKKSKFDKLLSEGKAVEAQREPFMAGDMEKFASLSEKTSATSIGTGAPKAGDKVEGETAQDKIVTLAEKLIKEDKAKDIATAQRMVLADPSNKDLVAQYEKENSI